MKYVLSDHAVENFLPLAREHGVVAEWSIRPWHEVLHPEA
jgi:hypothetical protein